MELHPPVHFDNGGIANNIQMAQATTQNLPQLNPVPVVPVEKQDLVSPEIINPLVQGFEESNKETEVKKNVEAIQEGRKKGIVALSNEEQFNQKKEESDDRQYQEALKFFEQQTAPKFEKAPVVLEKPTKKNTLFSDKEKLGIFAAFLSRGLGRPGPITENLGPALSSAALGLADIKTTEASLQEAKSTGKPLTVYDPNSKQNVLIRPENFVEGFHQPAIEKEKEGDYVEKFDKKLNTLVNVKKSELGATMSETDKSARYINLPKMIDVIAQVDVPEYNLKKGQGKQIPVVEYFKNITKYKSADPDDIANKIAFDLEKRKQLTNQDNIDASQKSMLEALSVGRLAKQIEDDIIAGAYTGAAGDMITFANSFRAFTGQFLKPIMGSENKAVRQDYQRMKSELNALVADPARASSLYKDGVVNFVRKISTLSASQKSAMIDLAYTLAKAREPGGRFSVTDIELAMATLGNNSDPKQMLFVMQRVAGRGIQQAIDKHSFYTGKAEIDFDPIFQEVIQFRNYLKGDGDAPIFEQIEEDDDPDPDPPI